MLELTRFLPWRREPTTRKGQLLPQGVEFTIHRGETLLSSLLDAGFKAPHDCRVGSCTKCKCRVISGKIKERLDSAYVLPAPEIAQGYVLACQTEARGDVKITYRRSRDR